MIVIVLARTTRGSTLQFDARGCDSFGLAGRTLSAEDPVSRDTMDLKTGCIFWRDRDRRPTAYPRLDRDLQCDVAIIGGGITGALAAYFLSKAGAHVIVLDRRSICTGSTPASTGLLQYEIDTPLLKLIELVGKSNAQRAYSLSMRSLRAFEELIKDLDDPCDLAARPSLYLGRETDDAGELRIESGARRQIGIEVEYLSASDLQRDFGIRRPAALWSQRALEVDPYRLTMSLFRRSATLGAAIFERSEVTRYEPNEDGVMLRTAAGPGVRACRVVFATGYETPEFLDQQICTLKSTYALASEPADLSGWRDRCLIWESGKPYFYARTTRDGRAIVGGEDEDFSDPQKRDALIDAKSVALVSKSNALMPGIDIRPACRWAGTFAETKDGLPYIGATDQFPLGYFALGYGGNGITFSLIAAEIIRDLFTGHANADAELFRFDR